MFFFFSDSSCKCLRKRKQADRSSWKLPNSFTTKFIFSFLHCNPCCQFSFYSDCSSNVRLLHVSQRLELYQIVLIKHRFCLPLGNVHLPKNLKTTTGQMLTIPANQVKTGYVYFKVYMKLFKRARPNVSNTYAVKIVEIFSLMF